MSDFDDRVTGEAHAPVSHKVQMPEWLGRPIVDEAHKDELETAAAVNEFRDRMPRDEAEGKAHADYTRRQRTEAAAHHLAGMKAAHAAGDMESARKHHVMYQLHARALGHEVDGPADHEVAAKLKEAKVYRFKPHRGDAYALGDRDHASGGPPEAGTKGGNDPTEAVHPLGKAEIVRKLGDVLEKAVSKTCGHCGFSPTDHQTPPGRDRGACDNYQSHAQIRAEKREEHHREAVSQARKELGKTVIPFTGNPAPAVDRGKEAPVASITHTPFDRPGTGAAFQVHDHTDLLPEPWRNAGFELRAVTDPKGASVYVKKNGAMVGSIRPGFEDGRLHPDVRAAAHRALEAHTVGKAEVVEYKKGPCRCASYNFPHRSGSGRCGK